MGGASPLANLMLLVMGAFAEFERSRIGGRQQEGITLAKALGVYRGRWKALVPREGWRAAPVGRRGEWKTDLARKFGISRKMLYQYLRTDSPAQPHQTHTGIRGQKSNKFWPRMRL